MKKGVSLVSLVIVVIVMIIIVGIVVVSGTDAIRLGNINMFATEILNIQTAVDEYSFEYTQSGEKQYPKGNTIVTLDISTMAQSGKDQFDGETITDNKIELYIIDMSKIGITELQYGNNKTDNDIYVVSTVTGKVYYLEGVEYDGVVYYTLNEDLYNIANIRPSNNITSNDIKKQEVIFTPTTKEYTNEPVEVQIKLPKEATINSVTATESKVVSDLNNPEIQGINKIITVNSTGEDRIGNYTITINYTYGGVDKEVTYAVTNFDNTSPTLDATSTIEGDLRTIKITATDDESGIKEVKYEEVSIEERVADDYFKNSGKQVINGTIIVNNTKTCTIYVVDNAGNSKVIQVPETTTEQ